MSANEEGCLTVSLMATGVHGELLFDDNYFNLLPGASKYVKIIDGSGGKNIRAKGVNSSEVELTLFQ